MLKQGAKIRKRNELPYSSRIIFFIPPYVTDLSIYTIIVTLLGVMEEYIYGFHSDEEIYCYWTTIPNIHFCFTGILWYLSDT